MEKFSYHLQRIKLNNDLNEEKLKPEHLREMIQEEYKGFSMMKTLHNNGHCVVHSILVWVKVYGSR